MFINRQTLCGLHIYICACQCKPVHVHRAGLMHKSTFAHLFSSIACLKQICFPMPQMIFSIREMIPAWFLLYWIFFFWAVYNQDYTSFFCYSHPVAQPRGCVSTQQIIKGKLLAGVTGKIQTISGDTQFGKVTGRRTANEKVPRDQTEPTGPGLCS